MGFNWHIQEGYLEKAKTKIPVHLCSPSDYECNNITLTGNEIVRTSCVFNVNSNGEYYVPEIKFDENCFIPEGITKIENNTGVVEIHNIGDVNTYISLQQPLEAFPLNQYNTYQGKIENNQDHSMLTDIEQLLRLDHLNAEERNKLIKVCNEFYQVFQQPNQPLSATTQTEHIIRTIDEHSLHKII